MRRAAYIALVALSIAAAALAMIAAYAVSPFGRDGLASIIEREIEQAIGGDVEIGSLAGNLSQQIDLNDIRFMDQGADWASIKRVTLAWSPQALFARRVKIDRVLIDDAVLLARAPARARKKPFKGFELPERLPAISIDRIELRNLQVSAPLVGDPLRLDGDGAIDMGGQALSVRARIKGADARDDVEIDIDRDPAGAALALRVNILSKPDGAIAALSGSGGAVAVSAVGSGPPSHYRIAIEAQAGAYGALSGNLAGNLERLEAIDFEATAIPGARFDRWQMDVGDRVHASGALFPSDRGGRIEIATLSAGFGSLSGSAQWRNGETALASAEATIRSEFSPSWRSQLQSVIGDLIEAEVTVERKGRVYIGAASARTPVLSATLRPLETDLGSSLSGELSAAVSDKSAMLARLQSSLRGAGAFALALHKEIRLTEFSISSENGAAFKGDASYQFVNGRFDVEGDIAADASAIRAIAPAIAPKDGATAAVALSGAATDFNLQLTVAAPAFQVQASDWPASSISVALSHLPASPTGELSLRAVDGSLRSFTRMRRDLDGAIALSGIDHRGDGFALTGNASVNPKTREGTIDLLYKGADGAEPWPGFMISGEASARGALTSANADNRVEVNAPALRTKTWSLERLSLSARGPADRLAFKATAGGLNLSDRLRLEKLKIDGEAEIGRGTTLSIASASADFEGAPVRLDRPAAIALGGGLAVDDLSIRVGENGTIDFSGAASPERWRAVAAIRGLDLSAGGSTLDFDLALDTANPVAAAGKFAAASGRIRSGDAALNGKYEWDGRRLSIVAGGGGSALDLKLDLPLMLRRAARLGVSMAGSVGGTARYEGQAETIALFLPLALQSLEGDLQFSGALSGSMKDPRLAGALSLTGGAYTDPISGLSVVGIDLKSTASASSGGSSVIFSGSASGAGQTAKTITATGKVELGASASISADIALDGARLSAGPVERVDATGTLTIAGSVHDLHVGGDVKLSALEAKLFTPETLGLVSIDIVAVGDGGRPAEEDAAISRRGILRYAVRISADDNVHISGRGLDSEWRANAQLAGTSEHPLVLGTMNLNRGDLEFSGRRFDLTRGSIGFDTLAPNDPTIDLRAERETRDGTTVAVVIAGRGSALKVSLESTPSKPSEDVMALILFDKSADELSAFQSLQVADALSQLGGVGVFGGKGVTGAARDALGLDLLNLDVDGTDTSASLLTVGKYVTDGLFVSASQNARGENGSLRIEYEIGQSFSIETELRQDGDQTVSANWKRDF